MATGVRMVSRNANKIVADILQSTVNLESSRILKSRSEDHVRILASLVPDEIIYRDNKASSGSYLNGVLLFVDVSGFTDLCEKYNSLGKGGPSRITQVLNAYMGAMVQEIMLHNGDIMKFSGDAFLALWKVGDDGSMADVVHAAIDCALGIQRSYGTYKTEVQIVLRVKIALSCGPATFTVIGGSSFMILGSTMLDVKALGNSCLPGDIVISSSMRPYLGVNEYIMQPLNFTQNAKILSIGSEWSPSAISNQFEFFDAFALIENRKTTDLDDESDIIIVTDDDDKPVNNSYMLRPSLDYAASRHMLVYLRNFIIAPVVRAINLNEPLDYLTEMRQVVIMFINVVTENINMNQLLQVCNESYSVICQLAAKGLGCVNKVSMFDKDLMYLVIFGLRGFKHALEAQRALYCAQEILEFLKNIQNISCASIGVCTGLTYCGVVGHPMRKEYTVIGRTVNKAARLMVAYPDMVSCDRQTFLQSQLQARHFKLQPSRYLKGFKNVGPIYRFCDYATDEDVLSVEMQKTNNFPLLDRHKETELLFFLLVAKRYGSNISLIAPYVPVLENDYNMLVIKGYERQGKTRLLYEIAHYVNDTDVEHNASCFNNGDTAMPYKIIRNLFEKRCGIVKTMTIAQRTEKVANFLHPFKAPEFLCGLNDMMHVNFEQSKYYLRLTDEQKMHVKRKMVKYLSIKAFKVACILITIDNIEYMDEESWSMFKVLLNTGLMFICVTLGNYGSLGPEAKKILERADVKIVKLQPVQKVYHAGLLCQFLNVMGVSLELERYIQVHSYGNPGWIESFLTTLSHSEALQIVQMHKKKAQDDGYVIPPYDMLFRDSATTMSMSSSTLLLGRDANSSAFLDQFTMEIEDWDIYFQAIKDNNQRLSRKTPDIIEVCVLPPNISLEDMDTEDILDVTMIKTYDSLKVHEQLLLKCSSILGDSFSRNMLEYVMQSQSIRKNAEAIQRLFEIRVFSCGRAKYTNGAIQIDHYLTDPNENREIQCYCTGFPRNILTRDLPTYANCGYMQFREPTFRQMLCNLLTDSQANLYHVRSMWYLESQTRRCLACGLGYFTNLIGQSNDDGMKKISVEQMPSVIKLRVPRRSNSFRGFFEYSFDSDERLVGFNSVKDLNITRPIPAGEKTTNIGLATDKHVRTFADNNLSKCECVSILITMYKQMIEHCQEAGINEKLMNALLEYASLCVKSLNITIGFTLLEKATELLDQKLKYEFPEPNWQVPLTRGRINLLKGQLHIERTAYDEAERCLLAALKCYNLTFPRNAVSIKSQILANELKQKLIVEFFPHRYIGSRNEDVCTLAEQTSDVMSSLFMLYRVSSQRKLNFNKAYLASVWGMNEALRSDSNFAVMCTAYSNILTMDLVFNRLSITPQLEDMALSMCYRKHTRLEKHELEAVAKLYGSIFCRKCLCENMLESLKLGTIVVQFNSPSFGGSHRWLMLPLMLRALMFTFLTVQAALVIQQMSYFKLINQTHFAPLMYYTLCLEFKTYTSYSIEEFSQAKAHVIVKIEKHTKRILSTIEMRYHVILWLWYVRKGEWESAASLNAHIKNISKWPHTLEPAMVYVFLHLMEGYLLSIVKKIDIGDEAGLQTPINYVIKGLKKLDKRTQSLLSIRSRFYLYKAYWCMITKDDKKAFKLLDKGSAIAKKCGVLYDIDWIEYTRQLWMQPRTAYNMNDAWQLASDKEDLEIDWDSMSSANISIPFFSLYLPTN